MKERKKTFKNEQRIAILSVIILAEDVSNILCYVSIGHFHFVLILV